MRFFSPLHLWPRYDRCLLVAGRPVVFHLDKIQMPGCVVMSHSGEKFQNKLLKLRSYLGPPFFKYYRIPLQFFYRANEGHTETVLYLFRHASSAD